MKKVFIYYNFIIITTMVITGFVATRLLSQIISSLLFFPLATYFWFLVIPKKKSLIAPPEVIPIVKGKPEKLKKIPPGKLDFNRRTFIKLIGSAGVSVFLFSIFTKRAHAAFFGSIPGPGTISIKDSGGTVIDPAKHHPVDGYRIGQLDDASPAYYGYTNKDGAWFILKEDSSGNYRYTKGSSGFSTNWTNRAALSYDYFENVF